MASQATNAGINFQCRISAWFLLNMLFENKLSTILTGYPSECISSVQLEGTSEIDDLILQLDNGMKLYYQIKRSISFSCINDSEFYKVVSQFVDQYINDSQKSRYILATSSKASNKIIVNLKKMLDSIRVSDINNAKSVFNKADVKLWNKFYDLCNRIFKMKLGKNISLKKFQNFIERVFIEYYDIEENESFEASVLLFISSKTEFNATLLWDVVISQSLTLATNRQSISKSKIKREYKQYLNINSGLDDLVNSFVDDIDHTNVWKDYLLISSNEIDNMSDEKSKGLYVIDLYRFLKTGKKDIAYSVPNRVILPNKIEGNVFYRSSTSNGIMSYLEDHEELTLEFEEITFIPARDSEQVNNFELMHMEWVRSNLHENIKSNKCIICGNINNDALAAIIEIDNNDEVSEVGVCHLECCRSVDRVMGVIKSESRMTVNYLRQFDTNKWIELLKNGQSMISGLKKLNQEIHQIFWNPNHSSNINGNFCVKNILENGDVVYTKSRGKVDRMSEAAAIKLAKQFDENHKKALKENNPICYSDKTFAYGPYNDLRRVINADEKLIACTGSEVIKYSKQLSLRYDVCSNFYAPLIIFLINDNYLEINNMIPLISNVLELEGYLDNWIDLIGEVKDKLNVTIVASDLDFDNLIMRLKKQNYDVVINPRFGRNHELISGAIILDQEDLVNRNKV